MIDPSKAYTLEVLKKLGFVYSGQRFADLLIYKKDGELYLLELIEKDKYRLFLRIK